MNTIRRRYRTTEDLLAEDITFYADGGKVRAKDPQNRAATEAADLLVYVYHKFEECPRL